MFKMNSLFSSSSLLKTTSLFSGNSNYFFSENILNNFYSTTTFLEPNKPKVVVKKSKKSKPSKRWKYSVEKETWHKFKKPSEIINEPLINELLVSTYHKAKDPKIVQSIVEKAKEKAFLRDSVQYPQSEYVQGLSLEETAILLNVDENNEELMKPIFETALEIKQRLYGNRIVLFTPLYVSNYCIGSCKYCGYRTANREIPRSSLSIQEIKDEIKSIENVGHKRVLMLTGESPKYPFDEFLEALKAAASVKTGKSGEIRRINVEIPQLSVSDFKRLKATDCVGTYILFQETYHKKTFEEMHPGNYDSKSDYDDRLLTMDRSMTAGIDDVGIGALFGLYDYRFEVMSLLQHAQHLDQTYHAGPHTISIPRIRPADNSETSEKPPFMVSDDEFRKLVAILRLAVPYTGMILTTREDPSLRKDLLNLGCSQMSAGSKTDVGSYAKGEAVHEEEEQGQFTLGDQRPTSVIIKDILDKGYMPSWCTACYRCGRTGETFMSIAKKGEIHNMCQPNAILTLAEYLIDYGDEEVNEKGWKVIKRELDSITDPKRKKNTIKKLERIKKGERDLYF